MALPHPAQTAMTNVAAADAAAADDAATILRCRHAKSAGKRAGRRHWAQPAAVQQAAAGVLLLLLQQQQQQQQQQSVSLPQPVFSRQVQQQLLLASPAAAAAATVVLLAMLLPAEGAEGQRCPHGATTNCGCCTVSDWSVWQVTGMVGGEYSFFKNV